MRYTLYAALGLAALTLALLGTSWFGLVTHRPMAKYATETERQAYVNSVAHQQGAATGIAINCANMRNVSNSAADRHAFAGFVLQGVASYSGASDLPAETMACAGEAKSLLATPLS